MPKARKPSSGVVQVCHPSEETGDLRFLGGSASRPPLSWPTKSQPPSGSAAAPGQGTAGGHGRARQRASGQAIVGAVEAEGLDRLFGYREPLTCQNRRFLLDLFGSISKPELGIASGIGSEILRGARKR